MNTDVKEQVRSGFTEMCLRYQWHWFLTFTFRESVHPERADKLYRVFISKLNRKLYGKNWYKKAGKQCQWCRAIEMQKRDVLHYHALLYFPDQRTQLQMEYESVRREWQEVWLNLDGEGLGLGLTGICRIYTRTDGAEYYVTKYVMKEGELEFSDRLPKKQPLSGSVQCISSGLDTKQQEF